MKRKYFAIAFFLLLLVFDFATAFAASNLEEGVSLLAQQISKNMQDKQKQKIAIIDFSDLNGNVTALGQFMAEELTTQLFIIAPGKFEVVERRQLLKLEEELSLGQMGFIEEKSIKKMGQVLGVDAIVTGSMTDLGNSVKINARLIGVDSAKVFAVAATDIPKTGMVADLIGKQAEGRQTSAQNKPTGNTPAKQGVKTEAKQNVEVKDFVFELQECKSSGTNITCSILITNKGTDRQLTISSHPIPGLYTELFDNNGNRYEVKEIVLGNQDHPVMATLLLISNVATKASVYFNNVDSQAKTVSLLNLIVGEGQISLGLKYSTVQFRNIPLSM